MKLYQSRLDEGSSCFEVKPTLLRLLRCGMFRTSPYMHDGSIATLEAVIEYYSRGGNANPHLDPEVHPLRLTTDERRLLVTFLEALTSRTLSRTSS